MLLTPFLKERLIISQFTGILKVLVLKVILEELMAYQRLLELLVLLPLLRKLRLSVTRLVFMPLNTGSKII